MADDHVSPREPRKRPSGTNLSLKSVSDSEISSVRPHTAGLPFSGYESDLESDSRSPGRDGLDSPESDSTISEFGHYTDFIWVANATASPEFSVVQESDTEGEVETKDRQDDDDDDSDDESIRAEAEHLHLDSVARRVAAQKEEEERAEPTDEEFIQETVAPEEKALARAIGGRRTPYSVPRPDIGAPLPPGCLDEDGKPCEGVYVEPEVHPETRAKAYLHSKGLINLFQTVTAEMFRTKPEDSLTYLIDKMEELHAREMRRKGNSYMPSRANVNK